MVRLICTAHNKANHSDVVVVTFASTPSLLGNIIMETEKLVSLESISHLRT